MKYILLTTILTAILYSGTARPIIVCTPGDGCETIIIYD